MDVRALREHVVDLVKCAAVHHGVRHRHHQREGSLAIAVTVGHHREAEERRILVDELEGDGYLERRVDDGAVQLLVGAAVAQPAAAGWRV